MHNASFGNDHDFQNLQGRISPVPLAQSPKQIELKSLRLDADKRFVVWWYGAICRSMNENYVPRVVVWFRQLHDNGELGNFSPNTVALTSLGQLRIGSVWKNQRSHEQLAYTRQKFTVNFREDHWTRARSSAKHREETKRELIPQRAYPLRFGAGDRSKLLAINHSQGTLLVPCLEFLRCYGRNQEVNRVLTTYGWDTVKDRLRLDEPITPVPGCHVVDLPWFATDDDAHLLAHLRYNSFTKLKVQSIRSQIEAELGPPSSGNQYAFPTIGPWFTGTAKLEVEGLELSPGLFLGLRVTGYTVPLEPSIQILRSAFPDHGNEDYSGKPHPARHSKTPGDEQTTQIGDDLTPVRGSEMIVVADPSIRIFEAAPVSKLTTDKSVSRGSPGPSAQTNEVSAPGEAHGSGKGVSLAHFVSATELESEGAVRDLWNGLRLLQTQNPGILTVLRWFSFDKPNSSHPTQKPKLVSLGFREDEETKKSLSAAAMKWVYMYPDEPSKPRGVLVIEIGSPLNQGYLFEVQRRKISSKSSADDDKEEHYCGLAIKTPAEMLPKDWIPKVLFQIAEAKGRMKKTLPRLSELDGQDYKRTSSSSDEVAGQSTAINALSKLGIKIPRHTPEDAQLKKK